MAGVCPIGPLDGGARLWPVSVGEPFGVLCTWAGPEIAGGVKPADAATATDGGVGTNLGEFRDSVGGAIIGVDARWLIIGGRLDRLAARLARPAIVCLLLPATVALGSSGALPKTDENEDPSGVELLSGPENGLPVDWDAPDCRF